MPPWPMKNMLRKYWTRMAGKIWLVACSCSYVCRVKSGVSTTPSCKLRETLATVRELTCAR